MSPRPPLAWSPRAATASCIVVDDEPANVYLLDEPSACRYALLGSDGGARRQARRRAAFALLSALGLLALAALAGRSPSSSQRAEPLAAAAAAPLVVRSAGGALNYTLDVDAGTWRLPNGVRFRTRLYNGLAPSPVLWAAPGDRVRLLVRNRLGANAPSANDALARGFREANTTNLHLHGVYDDDAHDDTFARVRPGEERAASMHPVHAHACILMCMACSRTRA